MTFLAKFLRTIKDKFKTYIIRHLIEKIRKIRKLRKIFITYTTIINTQNI